MKIVSAINTAQVGVVFCLTIVIYVCPVQSVIAEPLPSTELTKEQKEQFKARFKEDAAAILKVVDRWAKGWSELNVETYLSCYEKSFFPDKFSSAKSWRDSRRDRFKRQQWVKLKLTGMVLSLRGGGVYAVEFTQDYESDTYRDVTRKELVFRKLENDWRIAAENVVKQ